MVADRAYSPGLFPSTDRRASLFYFTAAVPAVGFVHGTSDLYSRDLVALESYTQDDFVRHGRTIDMLAS